jgi:hypothetical protein
MIAAAADAMVGVRSAGSCRRRNRDRLRNLGYAICSLAYVLGFPGRAAHAQAPITSRAYAIDLYDGVAIGNTTMTGMGGAGAANVIGTAGVLLNPAAMAVRATTDSDSWGLDWHLVALYGAPSSDYDNNGKDAADGASLVTAGLGGRYHDWGLAATGIVQATPAGSGITANAERVRVALSKWIPDYDLSVGVGVQSATFHLDQASGMPLFSITGIGGVVGVTWVPREQSFRLAAAVDTPIDGGQIEAQGCDPESCHGYILPDHVRAPWRLVAGAAMRLADTAWNQIIDKPFRDEQALTIAADIVVTGATDGNGIEAFGMHMLQPSGRNTVIGYRGGLDYELGPGRFRVRAGAYWEPGRFDGVGGRGHLTFGGDLRVFHFWFFGPRRGRISLTSDVARGYRNAGFSIGLWN